MSNHEKVYENLLFALNDDNHLFTTAVDGLKTIGLLKKYTKNVSLFEMVNLPKICC